MRNFVYTNGDIKLELLYDICRLLCFSDNRSTLNDQKCFLSLAILGIWWIALVAKVSAGNCLVHCYGLNIGLIVGDAREDLFFGIIELVGL